MQLRFTLTEDDYVEAQRTFAGASRFSKVAFRGLQVVGVVLILAGITNLAASPRNFGPSTFSLVLGLLWLTLPWLSVWRWRKDFRSNATLTGEFELTVRDTGLEIKSSWGSAQIAWAAFSRFVECANLFLLFEGTRIFRIIPKRAFPVGQTEEFRMILSSKIPTK